MKKIVFFIGNLNHSGGTERVSTDIANMLIEHGYQVTFINLWGGDNPFFLLNENIKSFSLNSVRESFKKSYLLNVWKLRKLIKKYQFDIFIDVESMLCLYSIPALINLKIRHICWEHFNFKINLGKKSRDFARQLAGIFADNIITLTERDKQLWEKGLYWQRANITAIPNPSTFSPQDSEPKLENKIFLAVGRLTYQKGFDLLLQAWKEALPKLDTGWKLTIVGDGEDKAQLLSFIEKNQLSGSVSILSSTKDIGKYYQSASIYVLSSRFEGFGLVLVEAMNFGLPAISFDCDVGPREIVKHNITGWLCQANDIIDLSNQLVLSSGIPEDTYKTLSDNSKRYCTIFSKEKISEQWKLILNHDN